MNGRVIVMETLLPAGSMLFFDGKTRAVYVRHRDGTFSEVGRWFHEGECVVAETIPVESLAPDVTVEADSTYEAWPTEAKPT